MAKIYLSSTFSDLTEHREAVYRTLRRMRHDVVAMEDYVATDERPLDKCLQDVADCDIYIGVFAWRHGYCPPGQQRSITELEFREADSLGKPCLIFLLEDDAPWSPRLMDTDRSAIDRLRQELARDYTVSFFDTPDRLAALASAAVSNAIHEAGGARHAGREVDPSRRRYYRTCLGKLMAELASQIRFYSISGIALTAIGLAIAGAGLTLVTDELRLIVGASGGLISATTVFPVAVGLHARKKKALLSGFEDELSRDTPAAEVLRAVKSFLDQQLQEAM